MKHSSILVLVATVALFAAQNLCAATIYVAGDASGSGTGTNWVDAFPHFQDAVAAAQSGDEIWVAGGAYTPGDSIDDSFHIDVDIQIFGGFAGTETSPDQRSDYQPGSANETIFSGDIGVPGDKTDNIRTIFLVNVEGLVVFDGVSLKHGYNPEGGASAIQVTDSERVFRNCAFIDNEAYWGGAASAMICTATFIDCLFENNRSGSEGGAFLGGIWCGAGFTGCTFRNNTATSNGGAIGMTDLSGLGVQDCHFIDNTVTGSGGRGGAIWDGRGGAGISNCVFTGNSAARGGAIAASWINELASCTVAHNVASELGGGVYTYPPDPFTYTNVLNTIIWGNTAPSAAQVRGTYFFASSNIEGSLNNGVWDDQLGTDLGGNIDADPLFVAAPGDLHLAPGSPCLGTGSLVADAPATDIEGNPRPLPTMDPRVDMGAYESGDPALSGADDLPGGLPARVTLDRPYPNPFNPRTTLAFELPAAGRADLRIFDVSGRLVRTLLNAEVKEAGRHLTSWDGRDDRGRSLAAGTYLVRLKSGDHVATRAIVLVK